jgi:uncharacterized protein YqeY
MNDAQTLKARLEEDYRSSLKAHQADRVSALRMALAGIQAAEKTKREPLSDQEVLAVLTKEFKTRRESLREFKNGGRDDLARHEEFALTVLTPYLPPQLTPTELQAEVDQVIASLDPSVLVGRVAIGQIMKVLSPRVKDRAGSEEVSAAVQAALARATSG